MEVKVMLFGGLEAWTPDRRATQILQFPEQTSVTMLECIRKFADEKLDAVGQKHFVYEAGGGLFLRPGIIVLVNETDWEFLEDDEARRLAHPLHDKDVVQFISTLHGG